MYDLKETSRVFLAIYDELGKKVMDMLDNTKHAGSHTEIINAEPVSNGIYLCVLETSQGRQIRKLIKY
jgi:hypothetical protein